VQDILAQGWNKVTSEQPAAEADAPAAEAQAAPAEAAAPVEGAEQLKTEAEITAGEQPAEGQQAAAATDDQDFQPSFEDGEAFGPQNFMKEIATDEGATKFFNEHPEVKNMVCAALRRDVETKDIRKIVPTAEAAREMATAASQHYNFDNAFLSAGDPAKVNDFLMSMVDQATIRDESGQPILDAQGKFQVHPALINTFSHINNNKLSVYAQNAAVTGKLAPELQPVLDGLGAFAKQSGDERLQAALDIISEAIPLSSQGSGEIPEELRPMAASLSEREKAIQAKEDQARNLERQQSLAKHTESVERVEANCAKTIQTLLENQAFAKAALTDFEKTAALNVIGEQVDAALDGNELYKSIYDSILQRPPSEARDAALRKHILSYTNEIIGPIAAQVVRQAKGGQLDRQTAKQSQVAAQAAASKSDPRGTSIAPPGSAAKTPQQIMAEVRQEFPDADIATLMAKASERTRGFAQRA